jgi:Penicillin-insensitive murein endopeptidase
MLRRRWVGLVALVSSLVLVAAPGKAQSGLPGSPPWSGTLSYTGNYHFADGDETVNTMTTSTVTVSSQGVTTVQGTYNTTTTIPANGACPGSFTGTGSLPAGSSSVRPVVVDLLRGGVDIESEYVGVPVTFTATFPVTDACNVPDNDTYGVGFPGVGVPGDQVPTVMYAPGQTTLQGSNTATSTDFATGCGNGVVQCNDTDTVSWDLTRPKLKVTDIQLFNRTPIISALPGKPVKYSPLLFLSASAHPYLKSYGPNAQPVTLIYATVKLSGLNVDSLTKLDLKIEDSDGHTAIAPFSGLGGGPVLGGFSNGPLDYERGNGDEFLLTSNEAAKLDPGFSKTENDELRLTLEATSTWGDTVEKDLGTVQQLVRYDLPNRYEGRDEIPWGGDDWVTPETRADLVAINRWGQTRTHPIQFLWGDMSRMDGGPFAPHGSHQTGVDADGYFNRYDVQSFCKLYPGAVPAQDKKLCFPTDYAADVLVALIRSPAGRNITKIFVAYTPNRYDAFYDQMIADDPAAVSIIRPDGAHDTHFHIRFKSS